MVRRRRQSRGALDVAEIDRIAMAPGQALDHFGLPGPHRDVGARAPEMDRQRRAPAPTADDGRPHARRSPSRRSLPATRRPMFSWWRRMTIAAPAAQAAI